MKPSSSTLFASLAVFWILLQFSISICHAQQQEWTNKDGKTMRAELVDYDPATKTVTFKKRTGATYQYPLKKLSRQSQRRITRSSDLVIPNPAMNNPYYARYLEYSNSAKAGLILFGYIVSIPALLFSFSLAAKICLSDFRGGEHAYIFFKLYAISILVNVPFLAFVVPNQYLIFAGQPPDWLVLVHLAQLLVQLVILPVFFAFLIAAHYGVSWMRGILIQILYVVITIPVALVFGVILFIVTVVVVMLFGLLPSVNS